MSANGYKVYGNTNTITISKAFPGKELSYKGSRIISLLDAVQFCSFTVAISSWHV